LRSGQHASSGAAGAPAAVLLSEQHAEEVGWLLVVHDAEAESGASLVEQRVGITALALQHPESWMATDVCATVGHCDGCIQPTRAG
jgi:hypothetical protein